MLEKDFENEYYRFIDNELLKKGLFLPDMCLRNIFINDDNSEDHIFCIDSNTLFVFKVMLDNGKLNCTEPEIRKWEKY